MVKKSYYKFKRPKFRIMENKWNKIMETLGNLFLPLEIEG